MSVIQRDDRSPERRALDERIAAEPPLPIPKKIRDAVPQPLESHLGSRRRPVAVAGIVENGLVRPLDADVHLPEHARVIIVSAE